MGNAGAAAEKGDAEAFRDLIDAVSDHAIFRLGPSGLVESWNSGAERIKGFTAEEIVGQSFARFYTEGDQAAGKPAHALAEAARHGRFHDEGWRIRKDGSRFWAAVAIDPIRAADGRLVGFAKVTRDITERHELDRTREQLHQAQKLEMVGQMSRGIAHDFNNLLTAVIGSFDLIGTQPGNETVLRLVEAGRYAATRGQRLVAQLLAFARQQQLHPEDVDVNDLIDTLQALLASAVGERITVRTELAAGLPSAHLDPAHFQSALLNLIMNARNAMADGGMLTIATRKVTLVCSPDDARWASLRRGDYVQVEVADTGSGMTEEVRRRAIEPFFTTRQVGGSGLGLSQVDGFTTQSGGGLDIESVAGRGTRVRMVLPVARAESQSPKRASPRRRAVLLVEDDAEVRHVAEQMLAQLGYEVFAAEDAVQALEMLQRDTPIDLLFSDIVMPSGIDGAELARRAVRLRPNLRVLLTSGHPRDAQQDRRTIGSEVVFLQKPYGLATLQQSVKGLLPEQVGDRGCG